jgi:hypothetical protein
MREKRQKNRLAETDGLIQAWPDDIVGQVFELWVGISRLMAIMREPDRRFEPGRALRPLAAKKTSVNRRLQRRNAA